MNNQRMNLQQSDNMNNQQTDLNNPFIGDADNRRTGMNSNDMHHHQGGITDSGRDTMMRSQNAGVGAPHTLMDNHPIDMSGQNKGARMTNQPISTGQQAAGMFTQPTGMHEHNNNHTDRSNPNMMNTQNTNLNKSNDMMHNNLNKSNDIMTTQASGHNNHHDIMNTQHLDSNKYQTTMDNQDTNPERYHDALNTQPSSNRHDLTNTHHTSKMTTGDGELNRSADMRHHQTGTTRGMDTNMNNQQQQHMGEVKTGNHPTTVEDVHNSGNNLTQTSNPTQGLRNNNTNLTHKNNLEDSKGNVSAVSSTPSEYGSSDDNTSRASNNNRAPLTADKNAFIQTNDVKKHWQTKMSPSERAKELSKEMDDMIKNRGNTTEQDKSLKIGESKEIKLD